MENSTPLGVTTLPAWVADRQGELTAPGIWALAQAVHGFCEKQRYPLWRFKHEKHDDAAIATWQQSFIAALADWLEVHFWIEEYERDWGMSALVHLSEREFLCGKRRPRKPYRNLSTLELEPSSPRSERRPVANAAWCRWPDLPPRRKKRCTLRGYRYASASR